MRSVVISLAMLAALVPCGAAARGARPPVVVELFTAQGCADCAQANGLVGQLAQRKDVLPLTFSVDYWDYLGWKDTFAAPEFGERQRAYAEQLKVRDIYTPEVVVGGRAEAPGVDPERVENLIRRAASRASASGAPRLTLGARGARVRVGPAAGSGELWLVRYDPTPRTVRVRGDDRKTRAVTAFNVVRELVRVGRWSGRAHSYPLPAPKADGLRTVVLLQGGGGGRILALARG